MIERYSLTSNAEMLSDRFATDVPVSYKPRYNIAPTQLVPVITSTSPEGFSIFYWGKPPVWAKSKSLSERIINLPVENLLERPNLKKVLLKFRCIVPADGFYAWKKLGKKTAIPYRVTSNEGLFSIPGIWEEFEDTGGSIMHTFTLLTRTADEKISKVTDRMPVIFSQPEERIWLDAASEESVITDLLKFVIPQKLNLYTVSPRINDVKLDVPSLIIPTPPADQHGNLTLFD